MFLKRENALTSCIIWIVIVLSVILFFMPIISEDLFDNQRLSKVVGSLFVLFGIVFDIVLRFKNKNEKEDERILQLQGRTINTSAIITLLINFFICMALYEFNSTGTVDIEWLWFIAYFTFTLFFAIANISYFIFDKTGNDYESL